MELQAIAIEATAEIVGDGPSGRVHLKVRSPGRVPFEADSSLDEGQATAAYGAYLELSQGLPITWDGWAPPAPRPLSATAKAVLGTLKLMIRRAR